MKKPLPIVTDMIIRIPAETLPLILQTLRDHNLETEARDVEFFAESYSPENNGHREELIGTANSLYASENIQFDCDANISESDEGCWVMGWLFVPKDDNTPASLTDFRVTEPSP